MCKQNCERRSINCHSNCEEYEQSIKLHHEKIAWLKQMNASSGHRPWVKQGAFYRQVGGIN